MGCYVPPLPGEPADDWVCLLCSSIDEILSVTSFVLRAYHNLFIFSCPLSFGRVVEICQRGTSSYAAGFSLRCTSYGQSLFPSGLIYSATVSTY